jgi:4-diphosphocytidyl-2-C-methyl-D-erythritol kinase
VIGAKAPAKINLFFEVGQKRSDSYHDVLSIYQSLDLFEEVFVEPASSWQVEVQGDIAPSQLELVPKDESNLVVKAATYLASHVGIDNPQPMRFVIHKRLPAAGGVAGGSADGAAALFALNEAWCLGLEKSELMLVGAKIGADVPFAILGGAALGLDSGIALEPIAPIREQQVLMVFSEPGLSTAKVFEVFDEQFPQGDLVHSASDFSAGFDISLAGRNSLLRPALALRPDLVDYMTVVPGKAHLSGSGPTLYLLSESQVEIANWQRRYADLGLSTLVTRFGTEGAGLI